MSPEAFTLSEEELKVATDWYDEMKTLLEDPTQQMMLAGNSALFVALFAQQTVGIHWSAVLDILVRSTTNRETVIAFYTGTMLAEELAETDDTDENMIHEIVRWMAVTMAHRARIKAREKRLKDPETEAELEKEEKKVSVN